MGDVGFIAVLITQMRETKAQSDSKSSGHRLQTRRPDLSSFPTPVPLSVITPTILV